MYIYSVYFYFDLNIFFLEGKEMGLLVNLEKYSGLVRDIWIVLVDEGRGWRFEDYEYRFWFWFIRWGDMEYEGLFLKVLLLMVFLY